MLMLLLLLFCPLQGHHTINTMAKAEGDNVLIKIDRSEKGHVFQASCAREGVNSSTQTVWKKIDESPTGHRRPSVKVMCRAGGSLNLPFRTGQGKTTPNVKNLSASTHGLGGTKEEIQLRDHIINTMTEARGDHITTEFDALANELENEMNSTNLNMSPQCCIFKIPNILRRHNPKAYAPNAFSIGPYHYGKKHLKATQKIKLKYLHDLISSFPGIDPKVVLRALTGTIREVQQEARDCYSEPLDHISKEELVKILVLDGCFLIELFRKSADEDLQNDDDPVFTRSCMREFLYHDLILLENQIPWLVLERLFDITINSNQTMPLSIQVLFFCYTFSDLSKISSSNMDALLKPFLSGDHGSKHILDLLRNSLVLSSSITQDGSSKYQSISSAIRQWEAVIKFKTGFKSLFRNVNCLEKCLQNRAPREDQSTEEDKSTEWQTMPSATRLREAGIKFKKRTSSSSILDIKFEDGILEIPSLFVTESTESRFRNLICLEQCLPNCAPIVTSYAILLDNLINTTKDMEILCKSGIIENWLNIDDATEFFNQLYDDAFVKEFYYSPLIAKVMEYCGRRWPRYRAVLMHDYFKHPWALFSVVAATILLILTFLQTLFSIIK